MMIRTNKGGQIVDYVFSPEHEAEAVAFYARAYSLGIIDGYAVVRDDATGAN